VEHDVDLSGIADPEARRIIGVLLNAVEALQAEVVTLRAENQHLRDENNRLKGEQGKPTILPSKGPSAQTHSSEKERRGTVVPRARGDKRVLVQIDRTVEQEMDPALLPPDAARKGYAEYIVQDVVLRTDTVRFRCARWYAPSTRRSYQAPLPPGYADGHYGPGIKALVLQLAYQGQMSGPKIREVLGSVGVVLSPATMTTLLHAPPVFATEYEEIARAGLASSTYQHLDETSTRVDGVEEHCHILCAPLYTLYHTTPRKDRQAVLDVLRRGAPRTYRLNAVAWAFLEAHGLPTALVRVLHTFPQEVDLEAAPFAALLDAHRPRLGPQQRTQILDAAAIGAYRVQTDVPVVAILSCDDAPQFKGLTAKIALCWVHAGRHVKKLTPYYLHQRALVDTFLTDFWAYYRDLHAYRARPCPRERMRLEAAFDALFARQTGYWHLDERIAKIAAKKDALLCVLRHPAVPLHNNPAELGARHRVRKRDVSFGPRSRAGLAAWDIFGTLTQTAAKLGVNIAHYLYDRLSGAGRLPSLAALIAQRTLTAHAPLLCAAA